MTDPRSSSPLEDVVARNRSGEIIAVSSVCSSHPEVLRASLLLAEELDQPLVIEATSNQVNQEGGYTGLRPADFAALIAELAAETGTDPSRLILGGDHLGPQAWRSGPAAEAMEKARVMVADYVQAGFAKIHLDCSEGCAGEPAQLDDARAAGRAADLARACREAARAAGRPAPFLVIGTEVPPPGGARHDEEDETIAATRPEAARATLAAHRSAFEEQGVADMLDRVLGLVVQPGVEFSPQQVFHLPADRDPGLRQVMLDWPHLCLEAHSTDYQHPDAFPHLAGLGFAFQKVGPALTFAWRRALYALEAIAAIAGWPREGAPLPEVMERLMVARPGSWASHYHGSEAEQRIQRHYGLADRIRYYWPEPEAEAATAALLRQWEGRQPPLPLLWEGFAPATVGRATRLLPATQGNLGRALGLASVQEALMPYFFSAAPAATHLKRTA